MNHSSMGTSIEKSARDKLERDTRYAEDHSNAFK